MVKPYSYKQYGLDAYFLSANYQESELEDTNDLSWLADGEHKILEQDQRLNSAALTLQGIFRKNRSNKCSDTTQSQHNQNTVS